MRALRPTAMFLLFFVIGITSSAFAAEVAELRNGFTILHRSREVRPGGVRLYLDEEKKSFVDLPVAEIERYSTQADPEPQPAVATPAAGSSAPANPVSAATAVAAATAPAKSADVSKVETSRTEPPQAEPGKTTDRIVREASNHHGVDSDFIRSVIEQESAGNSHAVSRAGAQGLMQLMPATAARLGVNDSFSPEQNVHGGARYLRELLERYRGDAIKALAAYNAGPGAVDRYNGVPPYRETRLYVRRVVQAYNRKKQNAAKAKPGAPRTSAAHVAKASGAQSVQLSRNDTKAGRG